MQNKLSILFFRFSWYFLYDKNKKLNYKQRFTIKIWGEKKERKKQHTKRYLVTSKKQHEFIYLCSVGFKQTTSYAANKHEKNPPNLLP